MTEDSTAIPWQSLTGDPTRGLMNVSMCIYALRHDASGRLYVGQTRMTLRRRLAAHFAASSRVVLGIGGAIKKYGKDAFSVAVLAVATSVDQLNEFEIGWIARLNTVAPHGFNLEGGGNQKKVVTEETRSRQREARANWLKTADRSVLARGKRGRVRPPEERAAISRGLTGRPVSAETREKIAVRQRGVRKPPERVLQMTLDRMRGRTVHCDNGRVFQSFAEAAREMGLSKVALFHAATGTSKTCGGYRFWIEGPN